MQVDDLKALLKRHTSVLDVTASVTGYVVYVNTARFAKRMSERMPRYRGMSVAFQVAPILFLGAPVQSKTLDTGVEYTARQGIFRLLVCRTVGQRHWAATLFIYDVRFQLKRRKNNLRLAVVSVERAARAHARAARTSLKPSAKPSGR